MCHPTAYEPSFCDQPLTIGSVVCFVQPVLRAVRLRDSRHGERAVPLKGAARQDTGRYRHWYRSPHRHKRCRTPSRKSKAAKSLGFSARASLWLCS